MCDLCKLVARDGADTKLYYEDSVIKICDCNKCRIPMVVFNRHGKASPGQKQYAMSVIVRLFQYSEIRTVPVKILDHEHWHIEGASLKEV